MVYKYQIAALIAAVDLAPFLELRFSQPIKDIHPGLLFFYPSPRCSLREQSHI